MAAAIEGDCVVAAVGVDSVVAVTVDSHFIIAGTGADGVVTVTVDGDSVAAVFGANDVAAAAVDEDEVASAAQEQFVSCRCPRCKSSLCRRRPERSCCRCR